MLAREAVALRESHVALSQSRDAGADCLYAPGISEDRQIRAIVEAVAPKAVNVLFRGPGMNAERLAEQRLERVEDGAEIRPLVTSHKCRVASPFRELADHLNVVHSNDLIRIELA